jgi:hypothetical protein
MSGQVTSEKVKTILQLLGLELLNGSPFDASLWKSIESDIVKDLVPWMPENIQEFAHGYITEDFTRSLNIENIIAAVGDITARSKDLIEVFNSVGFLNLRGDIKEIDDLYCLLESSETIECSTMLNIFRRLMQTSLPEPNI